MCTDLSKTTEEECQGEYISYINSDISLPVVKAREWVRYPFHYDNVGAGMMNLFVVQTFEGWPQILYTSIDSFEEDGGPVFGSRKYVFVFYMIYIIILAFFMINIFVGFVIVTFQREGEAPYADCGLDKNQRNCIDYVLTTDPAKLFIPKDPIQYKVWSFVTSPFFEYLVFGAICVNTVLLAMGFYNQPDFYTALLDVMNLVFTVFFTFEFTVKLAGFGFKQYFKDPWNTFDFVIVIGSFLDIIMANLGQGGASVSMLRLFRAMRLVKLLAKGESIRQLLYTFIKSFQALPYVALLIALVFFVYGVVGMQVFGKIALDDDTEIHRNNNFQTFSASILVLFRCATGEVWQEIMMSCIKSEDVKCDPHSDEAGNPDGCGSTMAYPYFVSFFVMTSFLILNLFVAVIMDNFDYLTRDWSILGAHHLDEFVTSWAEYDPDGKGRIKHMDVVTLLRKINPPLGFGKLCPPRVACKRLVAMNMPLNDDGTVEFKPTLFALVRTALNIKMEGALDEANDDLRNTMKGIWKKQASDEILNVLLPASGEGIGTEIAVGKLYASILIQDCFRRFTKKKFEREARERNEASNNASVTLMAGLRQFHESGPELKRTISGHLNEILDPVEPGTRRRNHPFFGGGDDSHHSPRKNIAFFAGAGPAIVQLRRPPRPHDVTLFDPQFPSRREPGPGPRQDDLMFGAGPGGSRQQQAGPSHRASLLFKEKSGEKLTKRMLVNEGLGRYCDEQFVKAQARELAEAANMSNQQFNSAARLLLERERAGEIELPMTNRGTYRSLLEEDWDPLDYVPRCPDPGHASPPPPPSRHRARQGARRK